MCLTIFVLEILLRWYNGFFQYWKLGWNVFDFFVVAISLLGVVMPLTGGQLDNIIRGLRSFRLLRSISIIPGLRVIVGPFVQSLPDVMYILFLLFLIILIFAVAGVTLFSALLPDYFDNLPDSMYSILIFLSQDGWGDILNAFLSTDQHWVPAIWMVLFMIIGPFILANAFIGVIVNNLQNVFSQLSQTQKAKHRQLHAIKLKTDNQKMREVTRVDAVKSAPLLQQQKPLEFADLSKLNMTSFENYCVILSAIEDNLAEFKQLKETLEQILLDVKKLNEQRQAQNGADSGADPAGVVDDTDTYMEPPGDIISQLIRHNTGGMSEESIID